MADQGQRQPRPAGWKKDPSGRHFGRYWDGEAWTEHVISAEKIQGIDPVPARPEPSLVPDSPSPPVPPPTTMLAQPGATFRGPVPTATGWTPQGPSRGPVPTNPPRDDPKGQGTNKVLVAIRRWPRWLQWTIGVVVVLVIVGAAASGGEDDQQPVSVVGDVATTLTLPLASTTAPAPATTLPPVTQAPTTEATAPATTRAPVTTAATAPAVTAAPAVFYANCTAVRNAGKAPLLRGQPGYTSGSSGLDRDGDGIACE